MKKEEKSTVHNRFFESKALVFLLTVLCTTGILLVVLISFSGFKGVDLFGLILLLMGNLLFIATIFGIAVESHRNQLKTVEVAEPIEE